MAAFQDILRGIEERKNKLQNQTLLDAFEQRRQELLNQGDRGLQVNFGQSQQDIPGGRELARSEFAFGRDPGIQEQDFTEQEFNQGLQPGGEQRNLNTQLQDLVLKDQEAERGLSTDPELSSLYTSLVANDKDGRFRNAAKLLWQAGDTVQLEQAKKGISQTISALNVIDSETDPELKRLAIEGFETQWKNEGKDPAVFTTLKQADPNKLPLEITRARVNLNDTKGINDKLLKRLTKTKKIEQDEAQLVMGLSASGAKPQIQERRLKAFQRKGRAEKFATPEVDRILSLPPEERTLAIQNAATTLQPVAASTAQATEAFKQSITPAKVETRTTLAKNLELAGIAPDSIEGQKLIRESITKPGVKIDLNQGAGFKLPPGFKFRDPKNPSAGVEPIPGGPKDRVTGVDASKIAMLQTAKAAFNGNPKGKTESERQSVRDLVFDKDAKTGAVTGLDRLNLLTANTGLGIPFTDIGTPGIPFTEGDLLRTKMEFGIQAITRNETGAAMPPAEVENTRIRFMPRLTDSVEIAEIKLNMFEDFLNGTVQLLDPTGRFNEARFDAELTRRSGQGGNKIGRFIVEVE